ncbi:MAG: FAD-dependent protein [Planctomycetota bacterium]
MPRDLILVLPPSERPPRLGDEAALVRMAARRLGVAPDSFAAVRVLRLSFDARPRHRGWRVALRAWPRGETPPPAPRTRPPEIAPPPAGAPHVVVIGSGPAGTFCALDLLAAGMRVTILERGRDVQARRRPIAALHRGRPVDPDCNYCFGEGGAGTYSDGKLHTRSGRREDAQGVLETFVAHGAPPEILVSWRPHVGSNRLPKVVAALRETIRRAGGEVRFATRAEEIETRPVAGGRAACAVRARRLDGGGEERFPCDAVVLATGHSALDSLEMAHRAGAPLAPKGFAMGLRIEHPQSWLDAQQYGGLRGPCELPPAFYELTAQVEERGVYSFCMCPGGFVVPASTSPDRVVVNGMSLSRRDSPFANAGVVAAIEPADWCGERGAREGWPALLERARALGAAALPAGAELPRRPEDDPLFGVRLQIALETVAARAGGGGNRVPAQRADAFVRGAGETPALLPTSYRPGATPADLAALLPRGLCARLRAALADFDARLPGFAADFGQLLGVESRTSSPVRIARDPLTLESPGVQGLHPAGEGAGYAGGIVSSALDGRRVAAAIAARRSG